MVKYYYDKYRVKKEYIAHESSTERMAFTTSYAAKSYTIDRWGKLQLVDKEDYGAKGKFPPVGYYGYSGVSGADDLIKYSRFRKTPSEAGISCYGYSVWVSTRYSRGALVSSNIEAEDGTYPTDGRHTDGYWYIRRGIVNTRPNISDSTSPNKTLYDGDTLNINGSVTDPDKGDVITVRYSVNNDTTRAMTSNISQGTPIPYSKTIVFKEGSLFDGKTEIAKGLADGTKHFVKLWAEDDKGGKSEEVFVNFYVVNNRPAELIVNEFVEQNDLIETDTIQITGKVSDPDKNETTLLYKVNSSGFTELNSGMDREFEVRIQVSRFHEGDNSVTIRARDEFGAITDKVIKIHKDKTIIPLKTAIREYKMTPPEGKAKGILLWIQREVGDLTTKVEIKFGSSPYKTLESDNTAPVSAGIEEDEYYYEHDTEEEDIRLRITMERSSLSSTKGIKLISGVFN